MPHEDPLAYALGLEGLALMRAFTGEYDRDFVQARIDEIRRLLDDVSLAAAAVDVARVDTVEGYGVWAETYDGPNPAFDFDGPLVREIAGALPPGVVLDAACGTGRIAASLAGYGHRVLGVDSSPDMLAHARRRVPEGNFVLGDLRELPVDDDAVDLVVCSLALTHTPRLGPVVAEFARVLRPGGHLLIADLHPERLARGIVPPVRRPDGTPGRLAGYCHRTGDYLRAALSAGLRLRRCEEPGSPAVGESESEETARAEGPGPWDVWPWSLEALVPEAARAANAGVPAMILWHFQLAEHGAG
ncbi:class I SAM-dependent methyltransferase [Streptomyces sp. S.PNR 29]|uniref:class I SAM-dependent methyltransferase n=1 Tax=Streptomyces sp. S.PNR 29 TaxID=2973805 RepID=UPI0025AFF8A2|nr:class I SAM-dependent methyltransferase [Streptomyces sp. S.PNR 29]MDN0198770.1 class I SAM-dependent methyltransferase [Streptomyces sp. S.PNR 29]